MNIMSTSKFDRAALQAMLADLRPKLHRYSARMAGSVIDGELVLGPFQGRPACIRIKFGEGVCGAAAATLQPQRVDDVNAFPGHIACDSASASELVVPIVRDGALIAVLDLDSPTPSRFTADDEAGCIALAEILAAVL